jgi:acetylornithine/succinyldiaminopimelate/putrescine aminotransferase
MDNKPFVNNVERLPVTIVGCRHNKLIDDKGNEFFDLWGDEGVASIGYGHKVNMALAEFIGAGYPHRLPDMYHNPIRTQAAQALCDNVGFDRVFFCNSGAEVNEAMIKVARRYWSEVRGEKGRKYIVTLKGNFHGRTGFALAASDSSDSPYHKIGFGPFADGFGVITEEDVIGAAKDDDDHAFHCAYENTAPFTANDESNGIEWTRHRGHHSWRPSSATTWSTRTAASSGTRWTCCGSATASCVLFDEVQVANGRTGYSCRLPAPRPSTSSRIMIGIGKGSGPRTCRPRRC